MTGPGPQIDGAPDVGASTGQASEGWARLDEQAATPRRESPTVTEGTSAVRLRRSRSSVLAALDEGGTFLQRRGRHVLLGSSLLLLPVVALNVWTTTLAFDGTGASTITAFGGDGVGSGIEDVAAMLVVLCSSLAAAIIGFYVSALYIGETFGGPSDLRSAIRLLGRRLHRVLVAWAVGHVWLPVFATWTLASRSAQVLGRLVVVLPVATLFATLTLLTVPVLVAENATAIGALRRSSRIARLRFGSAVAFVLASSFVGSLMFAGLAWLPALLEQTGFITFGGYDWLAQGIAAQLGVIIVVPLVALATTRFYIEMRMDAEGIDLVMNADEAFGRSASVHRP